MAVPLAILGPRGVLFWASYSAPTPFSVCIPAEICEEPVDRYAFPFFVCGSVSLASTHSASSTSLTILAELFLLVSFSQGARVPCVLQGTCFSLELELVGCL